MSDECTDGTEQRRCTYCGRFMSENRGSDLCIGCDDGFWPDGGDRVVSTGTEQENTDT